MLTKSLTGLLTQGLVTSLSGGVSRVQFTLPTGFSTDWNPDFNIYSTGKTYTTDYDFTTEIPSAGTVKWVDIVNGSDSNNGDTELTAYKTLAYAATQGANTYNVKAGNYFLGTDGGSFTGSYEFLRDSSIVAVDGAGTVRLIGGEPASNFTWTDEGDGIYSATYRASDTFQTDMNTMLDMTHVGSPDYNLLGTTQPRPIAMTEYTTLGALEAGNTNSFLCLDNSLVAYIKTHDGREPDENVYMIYMESLINTTNQEIGLYFDGITFFSRRSINFGNNIASDTSNIIINNCSFGYSNGVANVFFDGIPDMRILNSEFHSSLNNDGISYNNNSAGTAMRYLELNSDFSQNGDNTSDQGSTGHDDDIYGICINCTYNNNRNGIVDVDTVKRVILGCELKDNDAYGLQTFGTVEAWYKDSVVTGNGTANVSQESLSVITDLGGNVTA
jgi:hypothetical protein